MTNCFYFKIILVFVVICAIISENEMYLLNLPEGTTCQNGINNSPDYVCKLINNCSTVEGDIRAGKYPAICSFIGNDPVVCCSPSTSGGTASEGPPAILRPVAKSYSAPEMCRQYSELLKFKYDSVHSSVETNFTTSEPKYLNALNCLNNNNELLTQRIVGGNVAKPGEFPYMVLLGYGGRVNEEKLWGCGGSLISNRWILSAAHCVINSGRTVSWARLGDLKIESDTENKNSRDYQIVDYVVYPEYNRSYVYHDVALFRLQKDVEFSDYIRPVCLNTNRLLHLTTASIIGWGMIRSNGPTSPDLLRADISLITIERCQKSYPPNLYARAVHGIFDDSMICAGDSKEGKDTCSVS
ncbi:Hypothetical protein CINCED_3A015425 [Cinara cedri]|uniref:Peptidase S1 domain-containing protein n=1 Tax=Cinara cedri TaxID=506608 RepID=A0A5E4NS46_9HEMI|nr:Hypothetical protein CINCED_3A015425 [Cinara cedri]